MQARYYQRDAVEAVWALLLKGVNGLLAVLPTGAGKSLVIALLVKRARQHGGRVLILAHRKELLSQNAAALSGQIEETVGIFSAGLRRKEPEPDIVVAGIQSAHGKAEQFGVRHLIIIDEAHLINTRDEGIYRQFIADLLLIYPDAKIVGLTATPFRLGVGPITGPDKLFRRIAYEAPVGRLIDEGYLCKLTTTATSSIDTEGLTIRTGDYAAEEVERRFHGLLAQSCGEIVEKAAGRKSVLIFCSGVQHAEDVADKIAELTGEACGVVTGESTPIERLGLLTRFRTGELRWLANVDVLTTGFDNPRNDCVVVMRSTLSAALWAQMIGRGLRLHEDKADTLVLDFGGNAKRHGGLDDPAFGRSTHDAHSKEAKAAAKNGRGTICPGCGVDVPFGLRECADCGLELHQPKHNAKAAEDELLQSEPQQMKVVAVRVNEHTKRGDAEAPHTLRVQYDVQPIGKRNILATRGVCEWLCFDHPPGFARSKAEQWWQDRSNHPVPDSVADAVQMINRHAVAQPTEITVEQDGQFQRVTGYVFGDEKPAVSDLQELTAVGWDDVPF